MAKIKIAVAGCLGRMGQELSKQIINNNKLDFVGGFEHKKHKDINKQFKNVSDINSIKIIENNPTILIDIAITAAIRIVNIALALSGFKPSASANS